MAILRKTISKKSGLLDVGRVEPDVGHWRALERPSVQILDAWSRLEAMALTWSFESLETPIFSATLCTLRVLVPVAYISATAATRARSTRRWRSITSSGKKLPERSFGMRSVSVPAQVRATSRGSRFGCSPRHRSAGRPRRPSRRSRPVWRVRGAAPACRWRRR